ncbi:hypothetical protein JOF56_003689 [Kibdelosporangium banguiense]|uniref:Uncharacterized protein n=1 Tax=Kibdelosporangium banguiense TaxID=1365924 RepID=A0ABS4TH31_9PSEU|nr:hypothetical protein [Kibdelosporangium banguiense]MBP2323304.1 hypothetical protein [Kibdelosporangium banguiense]
MSEHPIKDTETVEATPETPYVLGDVSEERSLQVYRDGVLSLPDNTGVAWLAAAGEAFRITTEREREGLLCWPDLVLKDVFATLAQDDPGALRSMLIQLAATATAWAEDLDRRTAHRG